MKAPISDAREKRRRILSVIATAVFLALAINLLTSYLAHTFAAWPSVLLVSGLTCLFFGMLMVMGITFGRTEHVARFNGAILFKMENESITPISITGYSFNDDFCGFLCGFLNENKAYAKLFVDSAQEIRSVDTFDPDKLNRHTIINSVLEFTILHQLDLHLNSYFVENEIASDDIVTLSRNKLDPDVLRNRVIDLITRDMMERPAFMQDLCPKTEGIVFSSQGKDGSIYERLEIELPPRSKIFRNRKGFLVIANPVFELTIIPQYQGFLTVVPSMLMPISERDCIPMLASVRLNVQIKNAAFAMAGSMEMYEWLDSFIEGMREYISVDRLERRLDSDLIRLIMESHTRGNPKGTDIV